MNFHLFTQQVINNIMKKILFFFLPLIANAQQSTFSEKTIISEFNIRENNTINVRKSTQIFKDTLMISENYWRCVLSPNDPKTYIVLEDYPDYLNLAIEAWKDIPDSTGIFNTNVVTDSSQYLGSWRLNISGQITNGKIFINKKENFVFDPNLNQPITENIPLIIKSNLIKFKINGINRLLLKNQFGKYISNDKSIRFIKIE